MRRLVLVFAVATLGCGGVEQGRDLVPCYGKCDSGYVDFRKSANFHVFSDIVFDSPGKTDGCEPRGTEQLPPQCLVADPVETITGTIEHAADAKRHVYLLDATYGMHLKLRTTVTGYAGAEIKLVGPANQYGVWDMQNTLALSLVTGQNRNAKGELEVSAELPDTSMRPFGLFALVIGPRDDGAFFSDHGKDPPVRWTYRVEITCTQHCRARSPDRLTKNPVYFAHGFNASRTSWIALGANQLNAANSAWRQWANFATVPGYEPIEVRAEHLRRNLSTYLRDLARQAAIPGSALPEPDGGHYRVNVVAHSMGGLDGRYLLGHPNFNDDCHIPKCTNAKGQTDFCCRMWDGGPTESCCAPNGRPWRETVASLTTLSTPHTGSGFADWGLRLLESTDEGMKKSFIQFLLRRFVGQGHGYEAAIETINNLSTKEITDKMAGTVRDPMTSRYYDWSCATGRSCDTPIQYHDRPPIDPQRCPDGELWHSQGQPVPQECFMLPPPATRQDKDGATVPEPTIFSWAGVTCFKSYVGFGCEGLEPNVPAFGLNIAHGILNSEGPNDGVVSVESARFGIFMGIKSRDHFEWSSDEDRFAQFHFDWLDRLRKAGY